MSVVKFSNTYPSLLDRFFPYDIWTQHTKNTNKNNAYEPLVNVYQTEKGYAIELIVPGYRKEDIQIEVLENLLSISSKKLPQEQLQPEKKYTYREFYYQDFKRSFSLTEELNTDGISAKYEEGILTVSIPKKEALPSKPVQLITIE